MSFDLTKKLPTPMEIKAQYPVPEKVAAHKAKMDQELIDVISGKSDKFLAIIGPCSADNEDFRLRLYQQTCTCSGKNQR